MYSNDFQAFEPQSSPQGMPTKLPKFVEGTIYQLKSFGHGARRKPDPSSPTNFEVVVFSYAQLPEHQPPKSHFMFDCEDRDRPRNQKKILER